MAVNRVVIIGGGFAGVKCARVVTKRLRRRGVEIVLFNRENHMVFHPMLAEVVGSTIKPHAVAAPLRQMLPGVRCRSEEVEEVDLDSSEVLFTGHDGHVRRMEYDHVVFAAGSVVNLGMIPGMADHAFALKTIGDAMTLRTQVIEQMEGAEVCDDPEHKRWLLSFIIVGGGYSGVECAGEINDLVRSSLKYFHDIRTSDITVTLVHSGSQILPEISSRLRDFAREKMEKAGITMCLESRCAVATPEGVRLSNGDRIDGATIVSTIGNATAPVVKKLDTPKERGRMVTEPDMRLTGRENAWAVGDAALIVNAHDGEPSPPTAQFAERQGRQTAENIARCFRAEATQPFSFKPVGQLCAIGGHRAVAEIFGMRISGLFAFFLWRSIYWLKMPSFSRRMKVGFDWAWQLVFSRDLSSVRTDRTDRVSRAYYQPGDYIFREGDPATDFYVLESGEVEIVRSVDGEEKILAVLGGGDFFGEMALIEDAPRNASVRARSDVEVVTMGRSVFTQVSESLGPLRDLLAKTMVRRTKSAWTDHDAARRALEGLSVSEIVRELGDRVMGTAATLSDAVNHLKQHDLEFAVVVDAEGCLEGIVTQGDFLRALEAGAGPGISIRSVMRPRQVAICAEDSCEVAAATMRDGNLKWLPVTRSTEDRRVHGYVASNDLVARVLAEVARREG